MRPSFRHVAAAALSALALGSVAACGSDSEKPAAGTTAPATTPAAAAATTPTTTTAAAPSKPEPRSGPKASACAAMSGKDVRHALRQLGVAQPRKLTVTHTYNDEQTDCRYFANGISIWLAFHRAAGEQKHYWYRVEEQQEFHADDAGRRPKLIEGVGQDGTYGGAGAFWTPTLSRLISYRDSQMLLLGFDVKGISDTRARRAAVRLAKVAWRGLFGNRPPAKTDTVSNKARYPHP